MTIKEIQFSSMNIQPPPQIMDALLNAFVAQHETKAKPIAVDWDDAWNELVRFGLNAHGPDVSEIGTTWLGGLHTMDALRPFTPAETVHLGGANAFPPSIWQACHVDQNNLTMAIPFIMDVRLVLYRRDWLQKAGANEATAFVDSGHFAETLKQLKAAGHPSPFAMATSRSVTRLIHDMACWVWSAGGDIRSDDGRRMKLMETKSRAGMQAYFALNEFISPEMQAISDHEVFTSFHKGKSAVALVAEHAYLDVALHSPSVIAEVAENVGLAMLMQTPFVGGTALAVWRYSPYAEDALKLIQYLTSPEAWQILNRQFSPYTPVRLDLLAQSPLAATPYYPVVQQSLQNGRGFQTGYRWSGVESRLVMVIQSIWDDLRANPELNIANEVEKRFSSVCSRLEQTILVP